VVVAVTAIVSGCMLLVAFGSRVSQRLTVPQLLALYAAPAYISYLAVGTAGVVAAYAAYWRGSRAVA
jgi:hypothetical protein